MSEGQKVLIFYLVLFLIIFGGVSCLKSCMQEEETKAILNGTYKAPIIETPWPLNHLYNVIDDWEEIRQLKKENLRLQNKKLQENK
jgi:hypothetical protein